MIGWTLAVVAVLAVIGWIAWRGLRGLSFGPSDPLADIVALLGLAVTVWGLRQSAVNQGQAGHVGTLGESSQVSE